MPMVQSLLLEIVVLHQSIDQSRFAKLCIELLARGEKRQWETVSAATGKVSNAHGHGCGSKK